MSELITALADARDQANRGEFVNRRLQARILLAGMRACDVAVDVTSTAHALAGRDVSYSPFLP
jgi:hypothetical protein